MTRLINHDFTGSILRLFASRTAEYRSRHILQKSVALFEGGSQRQKQTQLDGTVKSQWTNTSGRGGSVSIELLIGEAKKERENKNVRTKVIICLKS